MSAIAGRVLLISRGDYNANTVYNTLDWVRHSNAAWICKADNTQNEPPSLSSTKWALMAADSAMSNLGDLNDVSISSEAAGQFLGCVIDTSVTPNVITWENVSAATTYSSTGTAPISGTGVADALADYYTKSDIPLPSIFKYGGTKTGTQLVDNSMLIAANAGYMYMASSGCVSTSDYLQGAGHYIPTGSYVAVLKVNNGYYFSIITTPTDEWNAYNGVVDIVYESSSLGWRYVDFHVKAETVFSCGLEFWAESGDLRPIKYRNPVIYWNEGDDIAIYRIEANVTSLPTGFMLKIVKY